MSGGLIGGSQNPSAPTAAADPSGGGAAGPWPGFGGVPPAVGPASIAGATGLASDAGHTHAGVAVVASGSPDLAVATAAATATLTQKIAADWTVGLCRVYAVDGSVAASGTGFADPATNSAADYAVACAAAGAVAVKTFADLAAILPKDGAGRTCEIVIAAGTYVGGLDVFLSGRSGYLGGIPAIRGTVTSTTAGCTKFDGSLADCQMDGAVTGTGLNAAGYNPTGAPTTTVVQCLQVGGAAPAFAAEPAIPGGLRVRFDAATSTAALRNVIRDITKVATANTLTLDSALPAVPAAADVFYIEQPGVICPASNISTSNVQPSNSASISGIACSGALTLRDARFNVSFCTTTSFNASNAMLCDIFHSMRHPVRGTIQVGPTRSSGATTLTACRQTYPNLWSVGGFTLTAPATAGTNSQTSPLFAAGFTLQTTVIGVSTELGGTGALGTPGPRIIGPGSEAGLKVQGFAGDIATQVDITGCGAKPAIDIEGVGLTISLGLSSNTPTITGSTGNTDVGLNLQRARNCVIMLNTNALPTVTGTAGDVRICDGVSSAGIIISWAQAALGIVDAAGNRFVAGPTGVGVASANGPTGTVPFSGAVLGGVGATLSWLANSGIVGAVNQTTRPGFVTSMRLFRRLRVRVVTNTMTGANVLTVELYKGGVATGQKVTYAVGASGTTVDSSHPILFSDTDQYDVRASMSAADVGAIVELSACLEFNV